MKYDTLTDFGCVTKEVRSKWCKWMQPFLEIFSWTTTKFSDLIKRVIGMPCTTSLQTRQTRFHPTHDTHKNVSNTWKES